MDQKKFGSFLRELRKEKELTQEQLAEQLNVSGRTVSRWETGFNMPDLDILIELSDYYGVDLRDLLAGERSGPASAGNVKVKMSEEKDTLRQIAAYTDSRERSRLKKLVLIVLAGATLILLLILFSWWDVIFQRGNPIPYLAAASRLDEETLFVPVDTEYGAGMDIYITERGEKAEQAFLTFIEESRDVTVQEQVGSGYLFTNGTDHLTASNQVYWSRYLVWDVPNHTLESRD